MVLAGTSLAAGQAVGLVAGTGMRTEFGRIAHLTQTEPKTVAPIQREITRLSRLIAVLSMLLGLALFVVGRFVGLPFWDNFVFAIGVIVANLPEGLLPTLTLSMAMAAQRMAARQTLTRHLPAVQTLGSATVICTDKTATLTRNRMVAQQVFVLNEFVPVSELTSHPTFAVTHPRLFDASALCHTVRTSQGAESPPWRGDPMEVALVAMAHAARPEIHERARLDLIPFSPDRRRMATLHADGTGFLVCVKGALETILPNCTTYEAADGVAALTDPLRDTVLEAERRWHQRDCGCWRSPIDL